jgi:uncharacterized protein YciI
MIFALIAHDQPGAVAKRLELRAEHLKFLDSLGDRLLLAGPFLNGQGEGVGTIALIDAATLEEAREVFGQDPFSRGGLFDQVTIKPWRATINKLK